MLKLGADQYIDLHDFDFAQGHASFVIIEQLIARKEAMPLCHVVDPREKAGNELSRKLKKLQRADHFIYEERGAKDLYVGWPFVRGKFLDGTAVRCPLMFFPVGIEESGNQWKLTLRKDVNFTLNKSFLQAYAFFNNTRLDEDLLERTFDDFDKDSKAFRTALYELFKDSAIELNFNQENFTDKLQAFRSFTKEQFDTEASIGAIKLFPEAVLGIFPQAGSYLVPDYMKLLEHEDINSLEEFFTSRTIDREEIDLSRHSAAFRFLDKVKEEQTFTPFKVDAFQENAIKAIKKGNSVVVQGPPGTGKSQLICNLIADYIARGKNVLVVCQKKAALDVVYSRLRDLDLQAFVALMHDFKEDRRSIYDQLATQVDRIDDHEQKNNSLDTIQIERRFLQSSRRIDQLSEELEEFRHALFDEKECGMSVKELYLSSSPHESSISIKQEYRELPMQAVEQFRGLLTQYLTYEVAFGKEDYILQNRKSFAQYGVAELSEIKRCLNEIPGFQHSISRQTEELTNQPITIEEAAIVYEKKQKLDEFLAILKDNTAFQYFRQLVDMDADPDPLWIDNMERITMQCFKGQGIEVSVPTADLGRFQFALEQAINARKNLVSWMKWELFSKDKIFISRAIVANGLKNDKEGFNELIIKIDNRLNFEHNISKIKEQKWVDSFPASYKKTELQNWFYYQKQAISAKQIYDSLRTFNTLLPVTKMFYEELRERFTLLMEIYKEIPTKLADWTTYLTPAMIHDVAKNPLKIDQIQKALLQDFDALCEYDKLREALKEHERQIISKLVEMVQPLDIAQALKVFDNSIKLAWIDHIEAKYPILRSVASQKLLQLEKELQEAVVEKMKISNEILLMKARERTYHNIEYNRLNNRVTYRDMLHQVTKKRRVWPVRKLIQQYREEVFNLVPCWLASPEVASAIFPMEELFDLVIFDEASQCFAEKGIPAMYRGKQVVITGDDKQLQPNDLYRIRWEGENEDELPELEVDSLLDLAKKYLMQVHLRGHYRSKAWELIAFSNDHFYDGKLRLLPDYQHSQNQEPPIAYINVRGTWENNTNIQEAAEVTDLVMKLVAEQPTKEIGVVTFNARQQETILDRLELAAARQGMTLPDSLFVKNIENVQGDEKDVIIFSTAYAPDKNGKLHLRFGSLNLDGGENRLNVAITRAKEKIYVVSSIMPHELATDAAANAGPKLLKQYLQYALDISEGKKPTSQLVESKRQPEWYLSERIKGLLTEKYPDVSVMRDLPFADLTVAINGQPMGLIVTDDQIYHDAVSVKDIHVYKPLTLSKNKWRFKGFFSRELWLDQEAVSEKLNKFVTLLM